MYLLFVYAYLHEYVYVHVCTGVCGWRGCWGPWSKSYKWCEPHSLDAYNQSDTLGEQEVHLSTKLLFV